MKRRIASLPPITLKVFENSVQAVTEAELVKPQHSYPERTEEEDVSPYQCLFCPLVLGSNDDHLVDVIHHMSVAHGLFIPDQAMLSDLASFLGYLATQIRVWHECLHCGITRTSTSAIQDHMKDSGHCRLNFEKEPELTEFWDSEKAAPSQLPLPLGPNSGRKLKFVSERMLTRKENCQMDSVLRRTHQKRPDLRARPEILQSRGPSRAPWSHQVVRRDEMGIQNIGLQQRKALIVAVKRSQKDEAITARAKEWTYACKANQQKHDQAHGSLSWAKGGMHNLLPR